MDFPSLLLLHVDISINPTTTQTEQLLGMACSRPVEVRTSHSPRFPQKKKRNTTTTTTTHNHVRRLPRISS
jgi:hypothetical protein